MAGAIYKCTANGNDFGTGTAAQWSQRLGINKKAVCRYANSGLKFKGIYKFENLSRDSHYLYKMPDKMSNQWSKEWDEVRNRIRHPMKLQKCKPAEKHWLWKN